MNDVTKDTTEHAVVRTGRWNRWCRAIMACFVSLIMIGIVIVLAALQVRASRLATIPIMDEPFNISEYVKWDVPADQDAFTKYQQAHDLHQQVQDDYRARSELQPGNWDVVLESGWAAADESLTRWLAAHREVLDVWRQGASRDRGRYLAPDTCDFNTLLPVIDSLRVFARLAMMQQVRCLEEGKSDEAWEWTRGVYRCGAHCGYRSGMIQSVVGAELHRLATAGIARWCRQPELTSDQLKVALATVQLDDSLYDSRSNILIAQYLLTKNQLEQHWGESHGAEDGSWISKKWLANCQHWILGEPELAIRTFRQTLANQIREIDHPVATRQASVGHFIMIFDSDPSVVRLPGEMSGMDLDANIDTSRVFHLLTPAIDSWDNAMLHQAARGATIKVVLAAHAYQRDRGSFPDSLSQMVPDYLMTLPLDPCDPAGGPLKYRLEDEAKAIVWSVGCDGTDEDGQFARTAYPRNPASTVPQTEETKTTVPSDIGFVIERIVP